MNDSQQGDAIGMEEMRRLWQEKARSYLYMRGYAAILARFKNFQARLEKLEVKEIRKEERGRAHEVSQKLSGVYCVSELSYAKILKNERVMYPSSSRLKIFSSPRRYHFSLLPRHQPFLILPNYLRRASLLSFSTFASPPPLN